MDARAHLSSAATARPVLANAPRHFAPTAAGACRKAAPGVARNGIWALSRDKDARARPTSVSAGTAASFPVGARRRRYSKILANPRSNSSSGMMVNSNGAAGNSVARPSWVTLRILNGSGFMSLTMS